MNYFVHLIDENDAFLKDYYETFGKKNEIRADSGLDILCPHDIIVPANSISFKIKLGIQGYIKYVDGRKRGYFLFPRSSLGSKTSLRQSNSVGLIDFGYRGEVMVVVDNVSSQDHVVKRGDRLCQIVAGDASPIYPVIISGEEFNKQMEKESDGNERGMGGFGSTGK
jgi:dUTP pyrophosphatase